MRLVLGRFCVSAWRRGPVTKSLLISKTYAASSSSLVAASVDFSPNSQQKNNTKCKKAQIAKTNSIKIPSLRSVFRLLAFHLFFLPWQAGILSYSTHGDRSQAEREWALKEFAAGNLKVRRTKQFIVFFVFVFFFAAEGRCGMVAQIFLFVRPCRSFVRSFVRSRTTPKRLPPQRWQFSK